MFFSQLSHDVALGICKMANMLVCFNSIYGQDGIQTSLSEQRKSIATVTESKCSEDHAASCQRTTSTTVSALASPSFTHNDTSDLDRELMPPPDLPPFLACQKPVSIPDPPLITKKPCSVRDDEAASPGEIRQVSTKPVLSSLLDYDQVGLIQVVPNASLAFMPDN